LRLNRVEPAAGSTSRSGRLLGLHLVHFDE
jgi:hypothetical protein